MFLGFKLQLLPLIKEIYINIKDLPYLFNVHGLYLIYGSYEEKIV